MQLRIRKLKSDKIIFLKRRKHGTSFDNGMDLNVKVISIIRRKHETSFKNDIGLSVKI